MSFGETVKLWAQVMLGVVMVLLILAAWLLLWGVQLHVLGEVGTVFAAAELVAIVFLAGYVDEWWMQQTLECGGHVGLAGRLSGFIHERTCRDRFCFLCSEWDCETIDSLEPRARELWTTDVEWNREG